MLFGKRAFSEERFLKRAKKSPSSERNLFLEWVDYRKKDAATVTPASLGLRVALLSDTHGALLEETREGDPFSGLESCDLCLVLGDVLREELELVLRRFPAERVLGVLGNHDSFSLFSSLGIRDLSGGFFSFRGVDFAGIGGSFRYKNEVFPSHSQYESLLLARSLPRAAVLLSHDAALESASSHPAHGGLVGCTDYVFAHGVQWHLHGHLHTSSTGLYENGSRRKCVYGYEILDL